MTEIHMLAPDWTFVPARDRGQGEFYFNRKTRHCQFEPPLFEILDLNPEEADNYSKSDIKAAWYSKVKQHAAHTETPEPPLLRLAYETLRHTRTRCEYVHRNVVVSPVARRSAANLLALLLMQM